MPQIFDNIEQKLLTALQGTMEVSYRADFCVGYFNLRGWRGLNQYVKDWSGGNENCCRLLVGMQRPPEEELHRLFDLAGEEERIDNKKAAQYKRQLAEEFRRQLTIGVPTNQDEAGLRQLVQQIQDKKLVVKLFLRHPLHAKLYLLFRNDVVSPRVGYLGSSNLTFAGLANQGELNIDVLDQDAAHKLAKWFEDRWQDRWCIDISDALVEVINDSWAREEILPPYYIYLKMAYHLSQDARVGLTEFNIPGVFGNQLFEFQEAAVKIAAHHLNRRGGVMIGDVVGMGKTMVATAIARMFEDDQGLETLIISPPKLVPMWNDYRQRYGLRGHVISLGQVINELPDLRPYRLVLIDESHNLRSRDGKRYAVIQDYINRCGSKVILLTATPYNKNYTDLSNQLRLFVPDDQDLGIRPEEFLRREKMTDAQFTQRFQRSVRSIGALEKSVYADDWRNLMRLYLVRRTRSFIMENYAENDAPSGRKYLILADGTRSYFPTRVPHTIPFPVDEKNPDDQYGRLYSAEIVDIINSLSLPRYGLGQGKYLRAKPENPPDHEETKILADLSQAGKRLMGFCRTNLFKRLESSGHAFILSLERHILRNYVFIYAIENNLSLPIGAQGAEMLDAAFNDEDIDAAIPQEDTLFSNDEVAAVSDDNNTIQLYHNEEYYQKASQIYQMYQTDYRQRFKWIRYDLFKPQLKKDLLADAQRLIGILNTSGEWKAEEDAKLAALVKLLTETYPEDKVIIFSQFADTAIYLCQHLKQRGLSRVDVATGHTPDPTALAWKFSPISNEKRDKVSPADELRILVATDVLSEGQNLQDAAIVVNYDLPWAIIRLIQRAGRVDRIGQKAEEICCYSFLPADGVEHIINLRNRVRERLRENAEVVGTDEVFFAGDGSDEEFRDLYTEKAGILDADDDDEVDLASYAYEVWRKALEHNPELENIIPLLPPVIYSSRRHQGAEQAPEGVLIYMKGAGTTDDLTWVDRQGNIVTQSQLAILRAAACKPDTLPRERAELHHELVKIGVENLMKEQNTGGGQLGPHYRPRYKIYQRLNKIERETTGTLYEYPSLPRIIDEIYRYTLTDLANETMGRQLKAGINDEELVRLVINLWEEGRLCVKHGVLQNEQPLIVCSLGLFEGGVSRNEGG